MPPWCRSMPCETLQLASQSLLLSIPTLSCSARKAGGGFNLQMQCYELSRPPIVLQLCQCAVH